MRLVVRGAEVALVDPGAVLALEQVEREALCPSRDRETNGYRDEAEGIEPDQIEASNDNSSDGAKRTGSRKWPASRVVC